MINHWWVTRPKRNLSSVPEVLTTFAELSVDQEWQGQRGTHLSLEDALEEAGLKRIGERRDQTGGGARTYQAWLVSLGLIFQQQATGQVKLTLAGEAIMEGQSPVDVLKNQILKYQFPSSYSMGRGVKVSERFRIRPFKFLLKLLLDERLGYYLTQEEIAKVVIVKAENETELCYNNVVSDILRFREQGDRSLEDSFLEIYKTGRGAINLNNPYGFLTDVANTIINWIEYTQLARRDDDRNLVVLEEKINEVREITERRSPFIDRPEQHEYFQRKFGLDPRHTRDNRNLTGTRVVTHLMIAQQRVRRAFITESLRRPIVRVTSDLVNLIAEQTGITERVVEETLYRDYPRGAIGGFMAEYHEMAFRGRDDAVDFERATAELFSTAFGLETEHIGGRPLSPDILVLSDSEGFLGIIDNKAYSRYTISNDHRNRMIHNYISTYREEQRHPLSFFSYIAGGFGNTINNQIRSIVDETGINGSAISVSNVINLVNNYENGGYDHNRLREIFSLNRQVLISDT